MEGPVRKIEILPHGDCNCGTEMPDYLPFSMLYYEETHFASPHYQSIVLTKAKSKEIPTTRKTRSQTKSLTSNDSSLSSHLKDTKIIRKNRRRNT